MRKYYEELLKNKTVLNEHAEEPAVATMKQLAPPVVPVSPVMRVPQKEQNRVLTALPNYVHVMLWTFFACGFAVFSRAGHIDGHELSLPYLVTLLYWGFCLSRLSDVCANLYNTPKPLPKWLIIALGLIAYLTCPFIRDLNYGYYRTDVWQPTSFVWLFTQTVWIVAIKNCILGARSEKLSWVSSISTALVANLYAGLYFLGISDTPWFMSWVVCQFACVVYLAHLIKDSSASTVARKSSTVTIPYHLFFAVTRWKEQQKQSLTSEVKNGALFSALIVVVTIALFNFGFANYRTLQQFILAETPEAQTFLAPLPGSSSGLQPFINKDGTLMDNAPFEHPPPLVTVKADNLFGFWALIVSALCFALTQLFIISKPTHIRFTPNGWQFLWRRGLFSSDGEPIRWESLERIYIAKDKLCFLLKNKRLHRISLSAIVSVDDRERFLLAIQQWASSVARDHSVNEALQPPPNHSYTELWLQALSAPPKRERLHPLLPGLTLHNSRYKVLNQLGTGGQGQAYLAQDQQDNIQVVLKEFILPVYVDTKVRRSALEQFENEARILRQLDHPQIVKLLDFFVEDHRSYLVLEHITGMTLRDLVIRDGPLPEGRVTALALQMCSILEYLHHREPPIVHRDFTPENLILSNEGSLRVIDFNVAKQIVEATTSGTVVGKHAYLPPEQFRGMPQAQSDIYAMGATMHFLLTGYDPEPISVSHPKQLCAHLSEHLNRIVERATALDVEKRYQSASQVAEELSQ